MSEQKETAVSVAGWIVLLLFVIIVLSISLTAYFMMNSSDISKSKGRYERAMKYLLMPEFCYRSICINENMTIVEVRNKYFMYSGYAMAYSTEMLNDICDG